MQTADIRSRIQADPDLRRVRDHIEWATARLIDLVVDKVVAHHEDPRDHPLPADARSPERLLHALFEDLPRKRRRDIVDLVKPRLKASGRAARYRELAAVDLKSTTPVAVQARPRLEQAAPKLSAPAIARIRAAFPESMRKRAPAARRRALRPAGAGEPPQPQGTPAQRLVLRLDSVRCVRKTRELLEGRDEIGIQAVGFDEAALLAGEANFDTFIELGKFKDGEEKAQNGLELGSFDFDPADGLPQGFRAVMFLGELDRAIFKQSKNDGFALLLLMLLIVGGLLAVFILTDGFVGAPLIWALIGGTIPFYAQVLSLVGDDIFDPENVSVFVADPTEQFAPESLRFRFGEGQLGLAQKTGEYTATLRFEIA